MCEAITSALTAAKDKAVGAKDLLIADRDAEGRPVGKGGRKRERDIMDIVDGAQNGLQIPRK